MAILQRDRATQAVLELRVRRPETQIERRRISRLVCVITKYISLFAPPCIPRIYLRVGEYASSLCRTLSSDVQ